MKKNNPRKKKKRIKRRLANEKDLNTEATERNHRGQTQNAKCAVSSALFTNTAAPGLRITVLNVFTFPGQSLKASAYTISGLKGLMQCFARLI